jgi:type II secretory ATPase GspE/PulE/Tfp pilus assembly ATPase PilB-like protein
MAVEADVGFEIPGAAMREVVTRLKNRSEARRELSNDEIIRTSSRNLILAALAEINDLPFWASIREYVDKDFLHEFDVSIMRRGFMVPLRRSATRITVAVANPYNTVGLDYCAQEFSSREIVTIMAPFAEIEALLSQTTERIEISAEALQQAKEDAGKGSELLKFNVFKSFEEAVPETLRGVFVEALKANATDIHFACEDRRFYWKIRVHGDLGEEHPIDWDFRAMIDGLLLDLIKFPREKAPWTIDVNGRFTLITHENGKKIECRYNRHLCHHGYHVTIRLLDKSGVEPKLETMGFDPVTMRWIRWGLGLSDGITIMSGPTGSGKTTTLNAILREVWRPRYNVMTLENPVEWEIPGVIHCNIKTAEEFRKYLTAFLRADPDIILVGEIRDQDSAELALEASRTGHQVFTTVHANSAIDILDRLRDFNIARADIGNQVRLLCAQRLVKLICEECAISEEVSERTRETFNLPPDLTMLKKRNETGCSRCFQGVKGRRAVLELLPIDREISKLIVKNEMTLLELEKCVREKYNLKSLSQYALDMLRAGETDIEGAQDVINLGW